jgi:hypothetical protein
MIGILRWYITSEWIHIPHLSKPEIEPQNPELKLTGRRVPTKTESVSESLDKITRGWPRLQLFYMPTKIQKITPRKPRTNGRGTANSPGARYGWLDRQK